MSNRLQNLSNDQINTLGSKMFAAMDYLMTRGGTRYQPFGWDWPTASVLWTRKYFAWRKIADEAQRRGIKTAPDIRLDFNAKARLISRKLRRKLYLANKYPQQLGQGC